jgi:hypothetical protein
MPKHLFLERTGSRGGPDYEFVLYTDYSDLFGGPVLFEEVALRMGTREQLEEALHWRLLPDDLLDRLARMEPGKRHLLLLARKGGGPGRRGSAGIASWPAAEAERSGLLERLKRELREAARDAEPADPEELPFAFIVQAFEYEPGVG